MAACLAGGPSVAASHRAAAGLHGLPGVLPGAAEVTAYGGVKAALGGIVVHRTELLVVDDLTEALGIPTTTATRTIVDMAGTVNARLLAQMFDHAIRRRLCAADEVAACLDRIGTRGRRGARVLTRLLEERLGGDSALEDQWLRKLRRAGLDPPARQHQLVVHGRVLVLDFAWPAQRVGLECDGYASHGGRFRFDHDRLRDLLTARAGWTVLRVTSNTPLRELVSTLSEYGIRR